MKYVYIAFATLCLLVVVLAGWRGRHHPERPVEWFPDMVRQQKVKPQTPDQFFADGIGPRPRIPGTIPLGFNAPIGKPGTNLTPVTGAEIPPATRPPTDAYPTTPDYYNTGRMGDHWGTGLPVPVTAQLLTRGQERFTINCAVCHGATGLGNGVTTKYGLVGVANYHAEKYLKMADGEIFNTITNGYNSMMGYGANIMVEDRWAIVAYIRALQRARLGHPTDLSAEQRASLK